MIAYPRLVVAKAISRSLVVRSVSTAVQCQPVEKFRAILEEYRLENFSREIPSRFKKEIIKAAVHSDENSGDGKVVVDCLNRILVNIGHPEACLSEEESLTLLQDSRILEASSIPASQVLSELI